MKSKQAFWTLVLLCVSFARMVAQEASGNIPELVILWDASSSMEQQDQTGSKQYVDSYLKQYSVQKVKLVVFNTKIVEEKEFTNDEGNWSKLHEALDSCVYDGATSFLPIKTYLNQNNYLLISDGLQTWKALGSVPKAAEKMYTKGKQLSAGQKNSGDPSVSDQNAPNANIQLDEVVVQDSKKQEEKTVTTGYGEVNKEKLGYAVQTVSSDDLTQVNTDIGSAINGKVSGVSMGPSKDTRNLLAELVVRGHNSFNLNVKPLVVLDGVPMNQDANYDFIDPNNVADITILKGLAATNQFGTRGNNGVVIITTKTSKFSTSGGNQTQDKALPEFAELNSSEPAYVTDLASITDAKERYLQYLTYKVFYKEAATYFLNAYHVFGSQSEYALNIALNPIELFPDKVGIHRAVAFNLEEEGDFDSAAEMFQLLEKNRKDVQTSINLANDLYFQKKYKEAFKIFSAIRDDKTNTNIDLKKYLVNSLKSAVAKDPSLKADPQVQAFLKTPVSYPNRLVLEWSDPDAEFEIQFIDSKNNYSTWAQSKYESAAWNETRNSGFYSKEFIIEEGPKGVWLVNLKVFGGAPDVEGYFKLTNYKNFGTAGEIAEIMVLPSPRADTNVNILKFTVN